MARKTRKDSKIEALPAGQRAKVNGWLFDKGLTYAQVAQACGEMFGLRISKSSVGRYYERETRARMEERRQEEAERRSALEMEVFAALPREQRYQCLLERIAVLTLDLTNRVEPEEKLDERAICSFTRILIEARHERNQAERVVLDWTRFRVSASMKRLYRLNRRVNGGKRLTGGRDWTIMTDRTLDWN